MSERIQITRTDAYFSRVSFRVTVKQAERMADDLRVIQNHHVSNPHCDLPIDDSSIIVARISIDRRDIEEYRRDRWDQGDVEGLS